MAKGVVKLWQRLWQRLWQMLYFRDSGKGYGKGCGKVTVLGMATPSNLFAKAYVNPGHLARCSPFPKRRDLIWSLKWNQNPRWSKFMSLVKRAILKDTCNIHHEFQFPSQRPFSNSSFESHFPGNVSSWQTYLLALSRAPLREPGGGQILTLYLHCVAGCNNLLLFLLEKTHQLTPPLTTRGKRIQTP